MDLRYATLVGKTGVGKTSQTLVEWVGVNSDETQVLAQPSALSGAKLDNFKVTFS